MRRALGSQAGQASVELVVLAPLLIVIGLGVAQLLAAGAASELADHAAEAGAAALLQERDPERSARAAVPGWSRASMRVEIEGRHVRVRLRPRRMLPGLSGLLEARAEADAGPAAELP